MATINLRDYYPFYHDDAWIEISDELAREISHGNVRRTITNANAGIMAIIRSTVKTLWNKRLPIKAIHLKPYMMHTFDIICFVPCFPACRINRPSAFTLTTFLA